MAEMKEMVTEIVRQVKQSAGKVIAVAPQEEKVAVEKAITPTKKIRTPISVLKDSISCPKCKKGEVVKGKQTWGCTAYRDGCDFRLPFEFSGKKISDTNINALCRKGKSGGIKIIDSEKKEMSGHILLNSNFSLSFEPMVLEELHCPKCKKGLIIKGKTAWGCGEFRNGCLLRIPFVYMGKELSESQMEQLIRKGRTGKINGFIGVNSSKIDARLVFDTDFKINLEY